MIVLDTNVLSEARRPVPDAGVMSSLHQLDEDRAFDCRNRRAVALLEGGRRREALALWLAEDLPRRFREPDTFGRYARRPRLG